LGNHFTILIPSYNVEKWVERNVTSALNQQYDNYDIVYIDDCSPDNTFGPAKALLEEAHDQGFPGTIKVEKNSFNKGKMCNVYESIHAAKDNTIIVILDGDDWLAHENVLSYLNEIYESDDIWMTNGSYTIEPTGEVVRPMISDDYWTGTMRKKSWQFSHLGTFRKELFCKVKRKDFMNQQGQYWTTTSDQAIMWPIAEMSGPDHFRDISEVLYVYNRLNPISDDRVHRQDQLSTEQIIRNKKPYAKLERL